MSEDFVKIITLSPVEARAGVNLRINNQIVKKCNSCNGSGGKTVNSSHGLLIDKCPDCNGTCITDVTETIEMTVDPLLDIRMKEYLFEGLGNYSIPTKSRGNFVVKVFVEEMCIEDETRDFTVLSYVKLENLEEQSFQEQKEFNDIEVSDINSSEDEYEDAEQMDLWAVDQDESNEETIFEEALDNSSEIYEPLMEMASPHLYEDNAFRLLEILPGISDREAKRTVDKIQKLRRIGSIVNNSQALLPLEDIADEQIDQAIQNIVDAEKKFLHEFFWIFPLSMIDDSEDREFISALQSNDLDLSVNILNDEIYPHIFRTPPSPTIYLADSDPFGIKLHNLAVLSHMQALNGSENWKHCYRYWEDIYKTDSFWKFLEKQRVQEIDNPLVRPSTVRQIRSNFPRFLLTINAQIAVNYAEKGEVDLAKEQVELIRNEFSEQGLGLEILLEIAQPLKDSIETLIQDFESEVDSETTDIVLQVKDFLDKSKQLLETLAILFGDEDSSIINWADKIGFVILNRSAVYGNKTNEWRKCLKIYSLLWEIPFSSEVEEELEKDEETFCHNIIFSEIEILCNKAVQECTGNLLDTPKIVNKLLVDSQNFAVAFENEYGVTSDWIEIVRVARSLMIEYANKIRHWKECLTIHSKLLKLPSDAELKNQLIEDKHYLIQQFYQTEIVELINEAILLSKETTPTVPLIIKDLLLKTQKILDKQLIGLGLTKEIITIVKDLVFRASNGILVNYVNEKKDFDGAIKILKILKPYATTVEDQKKLDQDIKTLQESKVVYRDSIRCWFCKDEEGNKESNVKVSMYGDVNKDRYFNQTKVTWQNLEVNVPRCVSCDELHKRRSKFNTFGVLIGGLIGLLLNLPLFFIYADYIEPEMVVLPGIIICGFSWIGFDIAKESSRITQAKEVAALTTYTQHPHILKLKSEGWEIGDRP